MKIGGSPHRNVRAERRELSYDQSFAAETAHATARGPKRYVSAIASNERAWQILGVNLEELEPAEREWVTMMEPLWRRAHQITAQRPHLDVSDVFHVLRNLQRTPAERL